MDAPALGSGCVGRVLGFRRLLCAGKTQLQKVETRRSELCLSVFYHVDQCGIWSAHVGRFLLDRNHPVWAVAFGKLAGLAGTDTRCFGFGFYRPVWRSLFAPQGKMDVAFAHHSPQ